MGDILYHFSEESDIAVFAPRPSRLGFDCVWTIDEKHAPLYFFPRECPRVAFWATPETTESDKERYGTNRVLAIESNWLERVRSTHLFVYRFDATPFVSYTHESPGTHLATDTIVPIVPIVPIDVTPVGDLLEKLAGSGWELRLMSTLKPLWEPLIQSTMHFSGIRLRNATGLD
jgi:hypothetical protein